MRNDIRQKIKDIAITVFRQFCRDSISTFQLEMYMFSVIYKECLFNLPLCFAQQEEEQRQRRRN